MRHKILFSLLSITLSMNSVVCAQHAIADASLNNTFYTLRHFASDSVVRRDIVQQHDKINLIITQAYSVHADGSVAGGIPDKAIALTAKYHIPLMGMVTNSDFSESDTDYFLHHKSAQDKAINALLQHCKAARLAGIQIDFEHMSINDSKQFTEFYHNLAKKLHQAGLKSSVAIVPMVMTDRDSTYLGAKYRHWSGVFDEAKLGRDSDFVTLMTYDQHVDTTTPGPVASLAWDRQIVNAALKNIPANKLSLGVPTYSGYWHIAAYPVRGEHLNITQETQIGYAAAERIIKHKHLQLNWDNNGKVDMAFFPDQQLYRYLFVENAKSFRYKYQLAERDHLQGVSVFRMGIEDPKIWRRV